MKRWYRYLLDRVRGPQRLTTHDLRNGAKIDWNRRTVITNEKGSLVASTPGPSKPGFVGVFPAEPSYDDDAMTEEIGSLGGDWLS